VYLTNAVKHFKWRRAASAASTTTPGAAEVAACRPWPAAEPALVEPTASQALLGRGFRVTQRRGEAIEGTGLAAFVVATVHPSSILRAPDEEARREGRRQLVADLAVVGDLLTRVANSR